MRAAAARWLPLLAVTGAAALFAWLNRGERVVVGLGAATFYRVPLVLVVFLAFLAGMLSMMLLTLRHDLELRRELRARGWSGGPRGAPASAAPAPLVVAEEVEDADRTIAFPADGAGPERRAHAEDAGDAGDVERI